MSPRGALRWDEVGRHDGLGDTALARLVTPYRDWIDPDDPRTEHDTFLDGHLVGNGLIQLTNPGFDEHFIGLGLVPWFGFGHCALLAWHLHRLTGWQLVNLGPGVHAPMVHTAVQTPDGRIVDYRGATRETDIGDYGQWLCQSSRWQPVTPDAWLGQWLPGGDPARIELGGHDHPDRRYDQFELALADYTARLTAASAGADLRRFSDAVVAA